MAEHTEDRSPDAEQNPASDATPDTPPEAPSTTPPEVPPPRRGRRFLRWLTLVAVAAILAILGAAAVVGYPTWSQPEPREILHRMRAAWENAESYRADGQMLMETRMSGMEYKMTYPFQVVYQQPNLMYAEYGEGLAAFKTVCDGTNLYVEVTSLNRVVKAPAPEDLEDVNWCQGCLSALQGEGTEQSAELYEWLRGNVDPEKANVTAGFDKSNEWLASLEAPRNTWVVTVEVIQGVPMTLWIDRGTSLMRQTAVEIGWEQIRAMADEDMPMPWGDTEAGKALGAMVMEMLKDMRLRMTMTCTEASVGVEVPQETFRYTPPEGAEITEVEKVEEMQQALMESALPEGRRLADQWPTK